MFSRFDSMGSFALSPSFSLSLIRPYLISSHFRFALKIIIQAMSVNKNTDIDNFFLCTHWFVSSALLVFFSCFWLVIFDI